MYEKIITGTRAAFRSLYPHGTLEDVTGPVIRYLIYSYDAQCIARMSIYDAIVIADEINMELREIALEEMRIDADDE